jgi:hypothetical protein
MLQLSLPAACVLGTHLAHAGGFVEYRDMVAIANLITELLRATTPYLLCAQVGRKHMPSGFRIPYERQHKCTRTC